MMFCYIAGEWGDGVMPLDLYEHNLRAYDAALALMAEAGKAAVIHPTGTGKSFIGFKLAEEHIEARICWLSPSEYIFKTQLENVHNAGGDEVTTAKNIRFLTYYKLMLLDETEIGALAPDYIVLDEFHRCGAAAWNRGVETLLKTFPDARILGLSATNIRYLDNQRDMADELFEGNVASEMTLGEAVARGILPPPVYITSVYSCKQELEQWQRQVNRLKHTGLREEGQRKLEALRRSLEKAEGLEVVFAKYIPEKHGKYIAFCRGVTHMREMIARVPEWFSPIDPAPHVYAAYAQDPETSRAFRAFKQDESEHLKLLFCIDMLNEGVHVEGVSGVILFRPTVSPILYKQQIGRALSAGTSKNPVIFDLVNNVENLRGIDALLEETREALAQYKDGGESLRVVSESFRVIDELRDCRALFAELQDCLSASWERLYLAAKAYFTENGHLDVPKSYVAAGNLSLGLWLRTQRLVRAKKSCGVLTEEQIAKLDAIGMIWGSKPELYWERAYQCACAYCAARGDLDVAANYRTPEGFALGAWIVNLRRKKEGLSRERIAKLDAIGMLWDKHGAQWEACFRSARDYFAEHGELNVPAQYKDASGCALGAWIRAQRAERNNSSLSETKIKRLDAIGMQWESDYDAYWEARFAEAAAYFVARGNLDIPVAYKSEDGALLGRWLRRQRDAKDKLSPNRIARLDAIGMLWDRGDAWETRYLLAKRYYEELGHLRIPQQYKTDGDIWLGKWLYLQRTIRSGQVAGETLSAERIAKLDAIGMIWVSANERNWESKYQAAADYYARHGNLNVQLSFCTADGFRLGLWLKNQRKRKGEEKMTWEQIARLDKIGMQWEVKSRGAAVKNTGQAETRPPASGFV
jgi:superfamily II DNA or RNA helicase